LIPYPVDPNILKPHPRNYRAHPPQQLDHIEESIKTHGFYRNVVVAQGDVILAGHGVVEAAKRMGKKEIPVIRLDVKPGSAAALKVLTSDNEIGRLAEVDDGELSRILKDIADTDAGGLLGTGFDDVSLAKLLAQVSPGEVVEDDVPDVRPTGIMPGDLFELGEHRIICGDSTDAAVVMRLLENKRPRLMATDPPYGVDYDPAWRKKALGDGAERSVGTVQNDGRVDWSEAFKLFAGAVAYVWHASMFGAQVEQSLLAAEFILRSQIIWAKQHFAIGRSDYHWQHEACWYAVRKGKTSGWIGDRKQTTLWEVQNSKGFGASTDPADEATNHGTQKPVELFARPIRNHVPRGGGVYEPFSGSGTCIVAAEQLERRCYAVEIDPQYVQVALDRWEKLTGKVPEKL
jgi:DNA modification methylase